MENKINVAKLLKDCPSGMELDCVSYNNVSFDKISNDKKAAYPIFCYITDEKGNRNGISFTKNGCESKRYGAKCAIFPKGKTTWEGFQRPFKDGDIIYIITKNNNKYITIFKDEFDNYIETYIDLTIVNSKYSLNSSFYLDNIKEQRLTTEEEKQKLFDAIKANGYKWNDKTMTLEKLIKPKFKVGDRIKSKINGYEYIITEVRDDYIIKHLNSKSSYNVQISNEDTFDLVLNEFNINNFKPFDKVLVRDNNDCIWKADFYSHYENNKNYSNVCTGDAYNQCIPYNEETVNLIGTTNACPDKYKTWKDE